MRFVNTLAKVLFLVLFIGPGLHKASGLAQLSLPAQTSASAPPAPANNVFSLYLPFVNTPPSPVPLPPPIAVSAAPPIDFDEIRSSLRAQGHDLAFNKIGFHTGVYGNTDGLFDMMAELDAAGVPFFIKSVDNAEPLYQGQQLMKASGVPHTLVFRRASGNIYDVPNYNLPPEQAAHEHWQRHLAVFPPELDPNLVWMETINEVDKNRSEWLAHFALATARMALADGRRWAAFGWSTGEPEIAHWQSPAMLEFLRLVAAHPDRLAIALHEYSLTADHIGNGYPYLVGRFQTLFRVCDEHNIPRPTVLITEWGWGADHVPDVAQAMEDIRWASWLYAAYPQVKGAAIWYLGGGFGDIADEVQPLIAPVGEYGRANYFIITPGQGLIDPNLFHPNPAARGQAEGRQRPQVRQNGR